MDMANKEQMLVISQYLKTIWNNALAEKGWSVKELADKARVSYNYCRQIVNGTRIPARNPLFRMCKAAGLDFPSVWEQLQSEQELPDIPIGGEGITTRDITPVFNGIYQMFAEGIDRLSPKEKEASEKLYRQALNGIFDQLPIEGRLELLYQARKLADHYGAKLQS